ncbi:serine hydrolase domain-containing protein [Alteraurantiacibacter aquimixticola]|uniref:Class A beta-lactamase-related serine hydrolase n=1 Tax=Alteraurantiacibacter aquimixticola TaxID=2489173 RepID=A0A4V4U937_9SPHN|nr:serine hydrolase domain-containing protein [Alteraurantiacibacter aquimixticola]TIX49037.1 class A beta-lactamase-related serine hydrolase [Alteraurantiacibacter aquimixticola]
MTAIWKERLDELKQVIEADVARGDYYGAVLRIGRGGVVVFDEAIGHAYADGERELKKDDVFSLFSVTKAFTNVLIMRAIEQGRFSLNTKVKDVLPEFTGQPREEATFWHLITHQAGMLGVWSPKPGMYLDRLQELYDESIAHVQGASAPGEKCDYSPLVNHVLMGMALVRTDPKGRNYQTLLHEDLFAPLKMDSTSMGLRKDLDSRHVRPDMRGTVPIKHLSRNIEGDHALFEDPEVEAPHVGCASTTGDLWRFAEMLRREGELEGYRILSPRMVRLARKIHTGDKPNELYKGVALRAGWTVPPANQGLGFQVRGTGVFQHLFGQLSSPETFGNYGAGSTMFWVDPEADVSFSFLSAGVMTQAANIERCGKLSDLALSGCL